MCVFVFIYIFIKICLYIMYNVCFMYVTMCLHVREAKAESLIDVKGM